MKEWATSQGLDKQGLIRFDMIITCPDCSTHYNVDAKTLGQSGREVRCASCGHKWFASADDAQDEAVAPPPPEDEAPAEESSGDDAPLDDFDAVTDEVSEEVEAVADTPSDENEEETSPDPSEEKDENPPPAHKAYRDKLGAKARRKRLFMTLGAWGGVFITLALLTLIAVSFRNSIVSAIPRTAGFFNAIGKPADIWGVEIRNLKSERVREKGEDILRISAEVYNPGEKSRPAPLVRISLRDETDEEIHAWTVALGLEELPAKTGASFVTTVTNPPPRAVNLGFDFTNQALGTDAKSSAVNTPEKNKSQKRKTPKKESH
ncbi:MAG: hypothetical protein COA84_10020 [Robiginitomaculum sp.]|nr:MAG: hypothetical protein COA84_10020 [Robiginitomaculum sp.]